MTEPSRPPFIDADLDFRDTFQQQWASEETEEIVQLGPGFAEPHPDDGQIPFPRHDYMSGSSVNSYVINDASYWYSGEDLGDGTLQGPENFQQIASHIEPVFPTLAMDSSNEYSMAIMPWIQGSMHGTHSILSPSPDPMDTFGDELKLSHDPFGQSNMYFEEPMVSHCEHLPKMAEQSALPHVFEPHESSLERARGVSGWEEDGFSSACKHQKLSDVSESSHTSFPCEIAHNPFLQVESQPSEPIGDSLQAVNHFKKNNPTNLKTPFGCLSDSRTKDYSRLHLRAFPPKLAFDCTEHDSSYNETPISDHAVLDPDHGFRIQPARKQGVNSHELADLQPVTHLGVSSTYYDGMSAPSIATDNSPFDLSLLHIVGFAPRPSELDLKRSLMADEIRSLIRFLPNYLMLCDIIITSIGGGIHWHANHDRHCCPREIHQPFCRQLSRLVMLAFWLRRTENKHRLHHNPTMDIVQQVHVKLSTRVDTTEGQLKVS